MPIWATAVQSGAEGFESLNGPVRLRFVHGAKPDEAQAVTEYQ